MRTRGETIPRFNSITNGFITMFVILVGLSLFWLFAKLLLLVVIAYKLYLQIYADEHMKNFVFDKVSTGIQKGLIVR